MKAAIRPGRIIVHLSAYDDSFEARKRDWTPLKRVAIAIGLLPAFAAFIIPSFQVGRITSKNPSFTLPDELKAGEAFVLPAADEVSAISLQGRPLDMLPLSTPVYFGAIGPEAPAVLTIEASFKQELPTKKLTLTERLFTHPTVSYFKKTVRVKPIDLDAPSVHLPARIAGNYENEEAQHVSLPSEILVENKGAPAKLNATCWQPPVPVSVMMPFGAQLKKPAPSKESYRHLGIDLRTGVGQALAASGPGVVVAVSDKPQPGRTVTISHGGGLYSRYLHLKDSGVIKGEKVTAGQTIGWAGPIRRYEAPRLHWEVFFDKKPLDPQSFLALSSKLCDSK